MLGADLAHTRILKTSGARILYMEGDSYTFNFVYDYGFGQNWQVGFALPYVLQKSSNFGEFVDEYHKFLGLGKADIRGLEDPSFYLDLPGAYYRESGQRQAFGDLLLKGKYNFYSSGSTWASVLGYWKLPTGDKKALSGSGSQDFSLAVSASRAWQRWIYDAFASCSYLGDFASLEDYQKRFVYTLNGGAEYFFTQNFSFQAQLNGSSAYYQNTDFAILDSGSLLLFLGVKYRKKKWEWRFFLGEDIWVSHSPDVSLSIVTAYLF